VPLRQPLERRISTAIPGYMGPGSAAHHCVLRCARDDSRDTCAACAIVLSQSISGTLADLITLAHLSVSSAMTLPKSAGVPGMRTPPGAAGLSSSFSSGGAALISLLRLSMIPAGAPLGPPTPNQALAS